MCDTLVGREDWRWPVCGWERWFLQQNRATEADVRYGAASLSLTTYARPFAQDGDLFSNRAERRCHVCKGCASLGRAADWCPQKASILKVDTRWRSRPKPHIVCRTGSDGLRREVDERKSQESVLQRGIGSRSLPGRSSSNAAFKKHDPRARISKWLTCSCLPHRIARSDGKYDCALAALRRRPTGVEEWSASNCVVLATWMWTAFSDDRMCGKALMSDSVPTLCLVELGLTDGLVLV